jgi:hypothetical protein
MDIIAQPTGLGPLSVGRSPTSVGRSPTSVGRSPGGALRPVPIDPPLGWPAPGSETDLTVGVVDTGALLTWDGGTAHPFIASRLSLCPEDDADDVGSPQGWPGLGPADGHGTFVTGLILQQAPRARVRMMGALDVSSAGPDGLGAAEDNVVAAAIRALAVNPRVQVINLSFGGGVFAEAYEPPEQLRAALAEVDFERVAVVAAAGNGGGYARVWPAAFDGVISVGAFDGAALEPALADFSNRGSWVTAYAPGVDVDGPFIDQTQPALRAAAPAGRGVSVPEFTGWARWSGTSFAAATVSGLIARTAIERGVCGAWAAEILLQEADAFPGETGKLLR